MKMVANRHILAT